MAEIFWWQNFFGSSNFWRQQVFGNRNLSFGRNYTLWRINSMFLFATISFWASEIILFCSQFSLGSAFLAVIFAQRPIPLCQTCPTCPLCLNLNTMPTMSSMTMKGANILCLGGQTKRDIPQRLEMYLFSVLHIIDLIHHVVWFQESLYITLFCAMQPATFILESTTSSCCVGCCGHVMLFRKTANSQ